MRYIKITAGDILWGKDEITKDDLANSDTVIDLKNLKMFIKDDNKWVDIPSNPKI